MNIAVKPVPASLPPNDHPYRNGPWTPLHEEVDARDMEVIGEIPADIDGVYIRNTENPLHPSIGRYHPFDGDGMLHMMRISGGKAEYKNRFVRTKAFGAEQEAGGPLWLGCMGRADETSPPGCGMTGHIKDASSTDVVVHAGEVLSTHWQCGEGYRLNPATLETLGIEGWVPANGISAHPKFDPHTGELLFFNYATSKPYMQYGVVGPDNALRHITDIDLPGPRLPHDMAFTERYAILNDLPMYMSQAVIDKKVYVPTYHPDEKSRFGILPRMADGSEIKWFEAEPTYILHFVNAYEDGETVVMDAYFEGQPDPPPLEDENIAPEYRKMAANIDLHSMQTHLRRWRFDMATGETREEVLYDDEYVEFGTINPKVAGRKYRYVYDVVGKPGWFLFTGLRKHDLETGETQKYDFGEERYGSESPFIPRKGAAAEDDGYLVSFVTDMREDCSECVILDARDITQGPIARIMLPHRMSSGTHAVWAEAEEFEAG